MSKDLTEYIDDLSAAALDCKWRPSSRSEYEDTFAIASAIVNAFLAEGSPRNSPLERLPLPLLKRIFETAIAARGDSVRRVLQDVCRFFRSVVFTADELWNDIMTFPTDATEFTRMLVLSRWADRPLRLMLDSVSHGLRADGLMPHVSLLGTAIDDVSSVIIKHHEGMSLAVLRPIMRLKSLPGLVKLVICSPKSVIYPAERPPSWFSSRAEHPISISTPDLEVAIFQNICLMLSDASKLRDVRINSRLCRRTAGGNLLYHFSGRWPTGLMYDLFAHNRQLTTLHLFDAIRMDGAGSASDVVELPALEELIVACTYTTPAAWLFRKLALPESTNIELHLGYNGRLPLDYDYLFDAMAEHLEKRHFTTIVGFFSVHVTGVLLGAATRSSSRHVFPHPPDSWLQEREVGHRVYDGMPGAIDVYVNWASDEIAEISWDALFQKMAEHVHALDIHSLELSTEFDEPNALLAANDLPLENITELRLWHDTDVSLSNVLVTGLLGDDDRESPRIRDVVEAMISTFPAVTRIVDMVSGDVWEESSSTRALVEAIAATFVSWP